MLSLWARTALSIAFVAAFAAPLVWAVRPDSSGGAVALYPAPGTGTANPATTISLRGVDGPRLDVEVSGSSSGGHAGALQDHRDGRGVTFVPDEPFAPGEQVTVRVDDLVHTFAIAVPGEIADRQDRSDGIAEARPEVTDFATAPEVTAPVVATTGQPVPDLLLSTPGTTETTPAGAMITDQDGELVWWRGSSDPEVSFGNLVATELDGEPVLAWYEGKDPDGPGWYEGEWVVVDASYAEVARIPAANGMLADLHDIELTDRGTAWIMSYHPVVQDASAHGGGPNTVVVEGVLQEVDVVTGDVHFEWHSLDHVPLDWSVQPIREDGVFDYFHVNALVESPAGDLLVTARHTSMVAEIDRQTGSLAWVLGGPGATVDVGDDRGISFPHHARWRGDGTLSVFDNGVSFEPPTSRGVVYDLAEADGRATAVQTYETDPPLYTATQGSLQHFDDGQALAAWTEERRVTLFDADARPVGEVDLGAPSYRVFSAAWQGSPDAPPMAVVRGGRVVVSWNGATEVATWELLAGDSPGGLRSLGQTPRSGFETELATPVEAGQAVAVRALDAGGSELATSDPVVVDG